MTGRGEPASALGGSPSPRSESSPADRPERVGWELGRSAGDLSLRGLGLPASALGDARDLVLRELAGSPRPVTAEELDGLLLDAFRGAPPRRHPPDQAGTPAPS